MADCIYWDHNATSPIRKSVKDRMVEALEKYHANPSSTHAEGQACRHALETSRRTIANLIGCDPSELIFTASASESNMTCLWGLWFARTKENPKRKKIITSPLEHNSVYENTMFLHEKFGAEVVFAPLTPDGTIDVEKLTELLTDEVALVSIIGAQNEVGIIQPWEQIAEICESKSIPFHVDLVQCLVREELNLSKAKASAVTLCFHKAGGPKGIGIIYLKSKTPLEPILRGGSQEKKRRAGTENIVSIAGAAALAEEAVELRKKFQTSVRELRDYFEEKVKALGHPVIIVGEKAKRLSNTSYILFPGHKSDLLMMHLDLACICVSSGSACSSGIPTPSRSIMKLGFSEADALSGIRFSIGPDSTKAEADKVLEVLKTALSKKRAA